MNFVLIQHSSVSVDQSSTYHPQQYYYQSSQFYPYQSQSSLTNSSSNSIDQQQKSSAQRSLPLPNDQKNDSTQKQCDCKERFFFQNDKIPLV